MYSMRMCLAMTIVIHHSFVVVVGVVGVDIDDIRRVVAWHIACCSVAEPHQRSSTSRTVTDTAFQRG